jgi:hypothetical protein
MAQSQAFRSQVLDAIMIARVSPAGPQRARVNPKVTS